MRSLPMIPMLSAKSRRLATASLVSVGLALCTSSSAWADVYKSVDAQGHVVYSDRGATSTAPKTVVDVQEANPEEAARIAKEQAILKAAESQRKQQELVDERNKAKEEHDKQVRQARCESAKNRYYALKDAGRIYDRDKDGNRVYLDDEQADARRGEALRAMNAACAPR